MKAHDNAESRSKLVRNYIEGLSNPNRRADAELLLHLMHDVTKAEPTMWGTSIIGFGSHHYIYESGREGDTVAVGFSGRKQALAVYGLRTNKNQSLLIDLDIKEDAKGCVYINSMSKVNQSLLKIAIANAYTEHNDPN